MDENRRNIYNAETCVILVFAVVGCLLIVAGTLYTIARNAGVEVIVKW